MTENTIIESYISEKYHLGTTETSPDPVPTGTFKGERSSPDPSQIKKIIELHIDYLNKVDESSSSSKKGTVYTSWNIERLEFTNMFNFGNDKENDIDLSPGEIKSICGRNTSGKTNILNILSFILFRNIDISHKSIPYINYFSGEGCGNSWCGACNICVNGTLHFRITVDSKKVKLFKLTPAPDDPESYDCLDVSGTNMKDTVSRIQKIIGTYDVFSFLNLYSVIGSLITDDNSIDVLNSIFHFDKYELAHKLAKKNLRELENKVSTLTGRIDGITTALSTKIVIPNNLTEEISRFNALVNATKLEWTTVDSRCHQLQNEFKNYEPDFPLLKINKNMMNASPVGTGPGESPPPFLPDEYIKKIEELKKCISEFGVSVGVALYTPDGQIIYPGNIALIQKCIDVVSNKIKENNIHISDSENVIKNNPISDSENVLSITALTTFISREESYVSELNNICTKYKMSPEKKYKERQLLPEISIPPIAPFDADRYAAVCSQLGSIFGKFTNRDTFMTRIDSLIESLRGTSYSREEIVEVLQCTKQIFAMKDMSSFVSLYKEQVSLENAMNLNKEREKIIANAEKITRQNDATHAVNRFREIQSELTKIKEYKTLVNTLRIVQDARNILTNLTKENEKLTKLMTSYKNNLDIASREQLIVSVRNYLLPKLIEINSELTPLLTRRDEIVKTLQEHTKSRDELIAVMNRVDDNKEQLDVLEKCRKELEESTQQYNILSMYTDIINVLPRHLLSTKLSEINTYVNKFLEQLTNFKVQIELPIVPNRRSHISITISKGTDIQFDIKQLSGFESFILNIAVKAALHKICTSTRCGLLCIDEGMDCIDDFNRGEKFTNMINLLKESYDNIIIISHNSIPENICNEKIMIKNNGHSSEIE